MIARATVSEQRCVSNGFPTDQVDLNTAIGNSAMDLASYGTSVTLIPLTAAERRVASKACRRNSPEHGPWQNVHVIDLARICCCSFEPAEKVRQFPGTRHSCHWYYQTYSLGSSSRDKDIRARIHQSL
jgi:hypothetical protein